jgi:hypothetical protein
VLDPHSGKRADGEEGSGAYRSLSGVAGDQVEPKRADGGQDRQIGVIDLVVGQTELDREHDAGTNRAGQNAPLPRLPARNS